MSRFKKNPFKKTQAENLWNLVTGRPIMCKGKLNDKAVRMRLIELGMKHKDLAKKLGKSKQTVSNMLKEKSNKHVGELSEILDMDYNSLLIKG